MAFYSKKLGFSFDKLNNAYICKSTPILIIGPKRIRNQHNPSSMKHLLLLFTLLLASLNLLAQDQATSYSFEPLSIKALAYQGIGNNDSIEQLSRFLLHELKQAEDLRKTGNIVKNLGWVLFAAVPVWVAGDYVRHGGKVCLLTNILAGATFLAGNVMIPTGYVFKGKGTHRMKFLTEQLNQLDYSETFSIQITPTLMQYETPQAQNNIGLGVSINIGF